MKSNNLWGRIVAVAALLLLVAGGTAFAQLQTGNLYGTVTDDKGAALPGVTVTAHRPGRAAGPGDQRPGAVPFPGSHARQPTS